MSDLARGALATGRRTHTCGELRAEHIGQTVRLAGWVAGRRNLGGIFFVDLRDRFGITQVTLTEAQSDAVKFSTEWVLGIEGEVVARDAANPDHASGEIEVRIAALEVLAPAETPPFEIRDALDTAVETRLEHRFIDLRRGVMQRNLLHRSKFINAMRRAFESLDFAEIETPILTKATPEGARDYLVPSRVHPGEFYALPQSPQIFKQILMVSGFDRYFQVARCFRDEDLRADRQPEFTQLDMEMSFVEEEDVYRTWEHVLAATYRDALGVALQTPFPRLTWEQAMNRFGSDKPDTRFGMELVDLAEWVPVSGFKVFQSVLTDGGRVMGIRVPGGGKAVSRGQMKGLEELAKTYGAKGLAWWKPGESGGGAGPIAKFCADESGAKLLELMGAEEGDLLLFCGARQKITWAVLGNLRTHLGAKLEAYDRDRRDFLWVTEFPMFELDEESGEWFSAHHPFTAPVDETLGGNEPDRGQLASRAYDLVLNGWELGSGSIRIHSREVQSRIFQLLGISDEEAQAKFGFLLNALASGAPPHGGFALGLDRLTALNLGLDQIRDVIAFPKTTSAADLMCGAPSPVTPEQLGEVHVALSGRALEAPPQTPGSGPA